MKEELFQEEWNVYGGGREERMMMMMVVMGADTAPSRMTQWVSESSTRILSTN
jgi:hypothetical protein